MQVHRGSRSTRPVGMRTRRAWLKTAAQTAAAGLVAASPVRAVPRRWRIAHVMSFESPWRWTDGQLAGFQQALAAPDAEYRVFQMDVKRHREPAAVCRQHALEVRHCAPYAVAHGGRGVGRIAKPKQRRKRRLARRTVSVASHGDEVVKKAPRAPIAHLASSRAGGNDGSSGT